MAPAFDAQSTSNVAGGPGTFSFSHVVGAGASMFALTTSSITAITCNGVSLTPLLTYTPSFPPGTNCQPVKVWWLQNPTPGTQTIFVTNGEASAAAACVVTYTGINEVQPNTSNNEDSANNQVATWPPSVTPTVPGCWAVCFAVGNNGARKFSAGSSTTLRSMAGLTGAPTLGILDSNGVVTSGVSAGLNINVLNSSDNTASDFVSTITIAMPGGTEISVNDSITIVDSPNVEKLYELTISDTISITESVNAEKTFDIMVGDDLVLTESITASNASLGGIEVSETLTITEFVDGDYYPSLLSGYEEMNSMEDNMPLGMDDNTML